MQLLEKYGGICDCQISRDSTVYAASVATEGFDPVVRMLNEVSNRMLLSEEEVNLAVFLDGQDQDLIQ